MSSAVPLSPDDIDIRALGRAVVSRWRLIATLVLSSGMLTMLGLSFVTPQYMSEARILINNEETVFTRPTNAQPDSVPSKPDPEAVASQVQVLLSQDLAQEVVRDLNLLDDPEFNKRGGILSWPRGMLVAVGLRRAPSESLLMERVLENYFGKLDVYQLATSRVITVRFTSAAPDTAAKVANKLAQVYLTWQQNEKLRQTRDASLWLNAQIAELRTKVEESEAKAEEFRSKAGLFVTGQNNTTLNDQELSELNSQLIQAKAQKSEAETRARLIEQMLREKGDVDSSPDVLRSELIQRLLEQRVQVQRELSEFSATRLPSHPRIRQLQSELAGVSRQIREEAAKIVKSLQNEAQIAGAREASLRASLNETKLGSAQSNENQIKLRALERESKSNRDLLESYLARYQDANARRDETSVPADASIISRAYVSSVPSFPKKVPLTLLVMTAVGLLSLAYVLARELIAGARFDEPRRYVDVAAKRLDPVREKDRRAGRERRQAPAEFPTAEAAPVGIYPPTDPSAEAPGPAAALAPATAQQSARPVREATLPAAKPARQASGEAASLAAIARRLESDIGRDNRRRILVMGDGDVDASAEAIDLARQLSGGTENVALVDLTSRGRGIAIRLGFPATPGVRELARGEVRFEDVIRLDPGSAVQVLPAGRGETSRDASKAPAERVLRALDEAYGCTVVLADARALAGSERGPWAAALLVADQVADGRSGGDAAAAVAALGIEPLRYRRSAPASLPGGVLARLPFMRQKAAAL